MIKSKEKLFSKISGYETKESDSDLIKGGYIATTHLDSGWYDYQRETWVKDQIAYETLVNWAEEINSGNPRTNKVSVNHEREPHVTGVAVKGSARVDNLSDGEYGLYTDTLIDKTKESFEDVSYRIDKGLLDSYSIEFDTGFHSDSGYYEGAVIEKEIDSGLIRTLLPGTHLEGYTLAAQPMNEHAIMIKEITTNKKVLCSNNNLKIKEVKTMTDKEVKEEAPEEPVEEVKEPEATPAPEPVVEEEKLSSDDKALLKEFKDMRAKEAKEKEYKEITKRVTTELKESLKDVKVETKDKVTPDKVEIKEISEFKEALAKDSVEKQFSMAGKVSDKLGLTGEGFVKETKVAEARQYKNFSTNGTKLEYKGLGITTNQNSDTDYLLSGAELSDVFDPVIYSLLNQKTNTWNILVKDDFSGKGNNQVQFTAKIAANTTARAYTGNAVSTGNVGRLKYMTKFKKYQVGVEVDGDMIAAARGGPIGDVFAQEVKDSTDDLMAVINAALFGIVGAETAAGIIGFQYICESATYTSLYNLTRSTTNLLSPASAGDTFIDGASADVSIANLRTAIRQPIEEGGDLNNLVFIVSPIQYDKIKGIYDAAQRLIPTSARFGFEGRMEFDGVPIFYDKDCNDDDIFLVDLETHRVAVWVPPTLEMLGKDADSQKGFIKTYFATYNRAPRRMVQIHSNATS